MSENINTVSGAEDYLKKEGVDIDKYVQKGLTEICKHCQGLGFDPFLDLVGVHNLCPDCNPTNP
ncbi:MAG: hypothetical protein ABJG33_00175 [Balneola sp.]